MTKPFKFRYVNELVGSMVLVVIILVAAGIVLAAKAQGWFEKTYLLRLRCPEEGSYGLTEGAAVEILGIRAGSIERITVDPAGRILAVARIKAPFFENFINSSSRAVVKRVWGIAGDAYVEISRGRKGAPPLPHEGAQLDLEKDTELIELAEGLLSNVRETIVPAIDEIRAAAVEFRHVASELRDPEGPLKQTLGHINEVVQTLKTGSGPLPRALNDRKLGEDMARAVAGAEQTLKEFNRTAEAARETLNNLDSILKDSRSVVRNLKDLTADLLVVTAALRGEARDIPGLVGQTRETLQEAERLIRGLGRHWLLRSSMPPLQELTPLSPASLPPVEEH